MIVLSYLELTFFGFVRSWWIVFITVQRIIAVAFPLHAKLILTKRVFRITATALCLISLIVMILDLMFEFSLHLKLTIFEKFYKHKKEFLQFIFIIWNSLPVFALFILSMLIVAIMKHNSMKSSINRQHKNKKVTKITVCLALIFSFCELPNFIAFQWLKADYYAMTDIFTTLHSNMHFVVFMLTSNTFKVIFLQLIQRISNKSSSTIHDQY